ncbi:NAD(P)H-dependent oxidoreductase [Lachnospiraceae bacterium MD1]|jgi:multimeric flavodoxin WrbA|uniref:NAD(P)H-dependent oxidoreductase n=1 Tax=Variimorphobacter saccharofermentans TaxID=2755051 RepID=A0A839K203_9FIRM|nr:NAD(P)H-dependent oxidoreductase [Variimorphobacter saccharofermentans]MBB2183943.1 NAD(P)H-dependent oxidoreductase [Variimorphobacter saccharofermentans]
MKVAVVHGQAHKGSTYHLTQMLLDELDCNKEDVREFNINGIGQCVGCYNCILKDESLCPHRAQMAPIIEAIDQADVIIINTPNYCMGMTGQLKSFFDHMAYRWMSHRPNGNMKNKIGVAISTTAGMGASKATKDIRNQLFWWAVGKTYQIPFAVSAFSWDQIANKKKMKLTRKVKNLGWKINQKVGYVRPGVKLRLFFQMMKKMQKGLVWNIVDHDYWEKQGWI